MVLVVSLLVVPMAVASVSASCPPLKDRNSEGETCYIFPFLKDLIEETFEMGSLDRPDPTLAGITAWAKNTFANPVDAYCKAILAIVYKEDIKRAYKQYVSQNKVSASS